MNETTVILHKRERERPCLPDQLLSQPPLLFGRHAQAERAPCPMESPEAATEAARRGAAQAEMAAARRGAPKAEHWAAVGEVGRAVVTRLEDREEGWAATVDRAAAATTAAVSVATAVLAAAEDRADLVATAEPGAPGVGPAQQGGLVCTLC